MKMNFGEKPPENDKKKSGTLFALAALGAITAGGVVHEKSNRSAPTSAEQLYSPVRYENTEAGIKVHITNERKHGERFSVEGRSFICDGAFLRMLDESGNPTPGEYHGFTRLEDGTWTGRVGAMSTLLNSDGTVMNPVGFHVITPTEYGYLGSIGATDYKMDKDGQPIDWELPNRPYSQVPTPHLQEIDLENDLGQRDSN